MTSVKIGRPNKAMSLSTLRKLCQVAPACLGDQLAAAACAMFTLSFFGLPRPGEATMSIASPQHQLLASQVKMKAQYQVFILALSNIELRSVK